MTIETWRTLDDLPDTTIERPGREFAQQLLAWLDGVTPLPPTIEQSLASFQKAFPGYCLKKANWRESLLRLALNTPDGEALPASYEEYTEEQRRQVRACVEQKKAEARMRAEQKRQQEAEDLSA